MILSSVSYLRLCPYSSSKIPTFFCFQDVLIKYVLSLSLNSVNSLSYLTITIRSAVNLNYFASSFLNKTCCECIRVSMIYICKASLKTLILYWIASSLRYFTDCCLSSCSLNLLLIILSAFVSKILLVNTLKFKS